MFRIVTKATSANLGPGFDLLGICLELNNEFIIKRQPSYKLLGFKEEYSDTDNNLFIQSYRFASKVLGLQEIPFELEIKQGIPISRGLGSSSSMIVGGILAVYALNDLAYDQFTALKIANEIEGHPDNVAPCIFGGLCASGVRDEQIIKQHYPVNDELCFSFAVPDFTLSTALARSVLPANISYAQAINNSANILMLLKGLADGNSHLITQGIKDQLHVPYRQQLIPEYRDVENILLKHGAYGVTISGAGPTVLAIHKGLDDEVKEELAKMSNHWKLYELKIAQGGSYYEPLSAC